jgi:hypothetical protein
MTGQEDWKKLLVNGGSMRLWRGNTALGAKPLLKSLENSWEIDMKMLTLHET